MRNTWLYGYAGIAVLTASQLLLAEGPVAWVLPSTLVRVSRTEKGGSQTEAAIYAARGEYQSFQVAVQAPAGGLTDLNFSVSDLVMAGSGARIPRGNITLYREKYMKLLVHSPTWNGPPNLPIMKIDSFPDALIPFIDPATGKPPSSGTYIAVPLSLTAGQNAVFWVDVLVPRNAKAGRYKGSYTVSSGQGSAQGRVTVNVWNFTLPREPYLKSTFNGGGRYIEGVDSELLRNKLMSDYVPPKDEAGLIASYGDFATDTQFWDGIYYGYCTPTEPPTLAAVEKEKAMQAPGLYLYDDSADPESSCTGQAFYDSIIRWAQVFHRAGIENLVTQEPVPQLYSDGLGMGRSAVDIWSMLPLNY